MLNSMTGYGIFKHEDPEFELTIEIRSLNSRFLDINVKLPRVLTDKEMDIRNLVVEKLVRGKVNVDIDIRSKSEPLSRIHINEDLFQNYYNELRKLADKVLAPTEDLFKLAIQSPDVMSSETENTKIQSAWKIVKSGLGKACDSCAEFRAQEGRVLMEKFTDYISTISDKLNEIDQFEDARVQRIKDRIKGNFAEFVRDEKIDFNRFEQEILYYLEKFDISEEKVRLKNHLEYFIEVMEKENNGGKKLGFISQEIGREVNTIGAKANDSDIQKIVVGMKDELEKIKEQLANII